MTPSVPDKDRYQTLKKILLGNWDATLKAADAARQIKESKLYLQEFETWEQFCDQTLGFTPQHVNRLISAYETAESIPNTLQINKKSEPIGSLLTNEAQARALAKVPEQDRPKVLRIAERSGDVTAQAISVAAEAVAAKKPVRPDIRLDTLGRIIPEEVVPDWDRAAAVATRLRSNASEIKLTVERGLADKDIIFAEITNPTIAEASGLHYTLSQIAPHAVCPNCQGRNRKNCQLCRRRGWISKFLFNSPAVSSETKALLAKAAAK